MRPCILCGIAGVVPARALASDDAAHVLDSLAPRGPDDQGWAVLAPDGVQHGTAVPAGVAWRHPVLLHRRLSIQDVTRAGHQPMASPDGRALIVYNGEVYNFRELRDELETLGHRFGGGSDTEVVLAAYMEWGKGFVKRLVGMFAIAIADLDRQTLLLARDHFGVKPLYYAHGHWGFAFASDIPSLLRVPGVTSTANPERLHRYLATSSGISSYGGDTLFRDVKQLPPATCMELGLATRTTTAPEPYWDPAAIPRRKVPYDEAVAEVRRLLLDSVRLQLRSDVPVGAALSGGIDSSSIVSAVRHHVGPDTPIHTFSYLADDPSISEERWVRIVERAKATQGHGVRPDVASLSRDLPALVRAQGEPFGSSSIYAQFCVFRAAAAAGIPVMLDGQGADEILAGYRGYYPARLAGLLRSGRWLRALRLYRAMCREPGTSRGALRAEAVALALPVPLVRAIRRMRARQHTAPLRWLRSSWFEGRLGTTQPSVARGPAVLHHALVASIQENSLPHLLRYADRNSMAHSVESRVPFLDHRLVGYILSLPESYIIGDDATTKRVLRDAMRGLVPDEILDRRDKVGFQTTEEAWMIAHDEWVRATLGSDTARAMPFLDADAMLSEWEEIKAGKRRYSWTVWRWVSLIEWARHFDVTYEAPTEPPAVPVLPTVSKVPRPQVPSVPVPAASPMHASAAASAMGPSEAYAVPDGAVGVADDGVTA